MNRLNVSFMAGSLVVVMACGVAKGHAQNSSGPTLAQTVSLAVENSHEVALAKLQYTAAQNQARIFHSPFLPNVDAGSNPIYSTGFPETAGGQPPALFQMTYSQAILDKTLHSQYRAQLERAKSLEIDAARARDSVIVRAATSYLELGKAKHSLELLRNESASAQRITEYMQKRAATGMELPIEVTRSELTRARIEQHIAQLGGRIQILTEELHGLTALPPERFADISTQGLPDIEQPGKDEVEKSAESSPALKHFEFERNARQETLKGARAGYWPTVDLVGQYSVFAQFNNYQQYFKTFQRNGAGVGLLIRIPLFSPKIAANVALAKTELSEADLNLSHLRSDAEIEVKQAEINMTDQNAALAVARLELKLAQESLSLVQTRFDQGQATLRDIEQARLDEGEKWLAFLDSDFARQRAELVVMQVTGKLSQILK